MNRTGVSRGVMSAAGATPSQQGPISRARIGVVPIIWNNVDIQELRTGADADTILDEIARLGYEGTQLGLGFPSGAKLRQALRARGLWLAEVYASLPATIDGPTPDARRLALERLALLIDGDGDVLTVALDLDPARAAVAGRAGRPSTPRLTEPGWLALATLLNDLGREAADASRAVAIHQHAGTFVELPDELDRLLELTDPRRVGICLDTGHFTVGGGDPVDALGRFGDRVTHVHLKDVDGDVLDELRRGERDGFRDAIRARIFTELGNGIVDIPSCLSVLARRDYAGWLMVEQDSSWAPPSEAAAIGRRTLAAMLRDLQ